MEIPDGEAIHMIYRDQRAIQECFLATIKEVKQQEEELDNDNRTSKLEPKGDYELFILDAFKPDQTVKIEKDFPITSQMRMAETLVEYKDIFVSSSADLGIFPLEIIEHMLGIHEGTKLVFYKKHAFLKSRQEVTKKEVKELLEEGIIKSIDFSEALSNPVVVVKLGGT